MLLDSYITALWNQLPRSEFYWPYLLVGALVLLWALRYQFGLGFRQSLKAIFNSDVWLHRSTRLDIVLSLGYGFFWFIPAVAAFNWTGQKFFEWAQMLPLHVEDGRKATVSSGWWLSIGLTVWVMFCYDFASYATHRAMHAWRWLWPLHAIHHATEHLNIFSTHRQHPLEPIILNIARGAFAGLGHGLFVSLLPGSYAPMTIAGMGAGFFFYMLTINLHHLHVPVRYPRWLSWVLISPHVHHIHHSKAERHFDKNFGVIFSFWDRWFGTYHEETVGLGEMQFGINPDPYQHQLLASLVLPIKSMLQPRAAEAEKYVMDSQSSTISRSGINKLGIFLTLCIASGTGQDGFATPPIRSVSIVDEACELVWVDWDLAVNRLRRQPVPLPAKPLPFVCTRQRSNDFDCYSNSKKKSFSFKLISETSDRIELQSSDNRTTIIEIHRKSKRFQVISLQRDQAGWIGTEHCTGTAVVQ